jgi:hypothetical protein
MAEVANITFSYKEVATALVKAQDLHEGIWALSFRFGLAAMNMGENEIDIRPCAIVPVLEIGLKRVEKETGVAVNAAQVNPKPRVPRARKRSPD